MGLGAQVRTLCAGLALGVASSQAAQAQYSPEFDHSVSSDLPAAVPASKMVRMSNRYSVPLRRTPARECTDYIVVHWTDDYFNPRWVRNRELAHYLINRDGTTYRVVNKDRVANHVRDYDNLWNGNWQLKNCSIGIEVVSKGINGFTQAQYRSLTYLLDDLQSIYKIPDENVLAHWEVGYPRERAVDLICMPEWRSNAGLAERVGGDLDVAAGRTAPSIKLAVMQREDLCTNKQFDAYVDSVFSALRLPEVQLTAVPVLSAQASPLIEYQLRAPPALRP